MLRDACELIDELRGNVLAVSADPIESHAAFAARLGGLPFPVGSDASLDVARSYGVVDEGDPSRARRAIFVIDSDRTITLTLPHFQPSNLSQVEQILRALGAEL